MIDVVVAGAGPVGLVAAIRAASEGMAVVVVEPRGTPIDKACGEGLMPDALARLHQVGVDPPGVPFRGIAYLAGNRAAQARFSGPPGRGVRRTTLQGLLHERALDAGVRFLDGRVEDVYQDAGRVRAAGLDAGYLVGADGLHSSVRRALRLEVAAGPPHRFGVRQHFVAVPWTDMVEVHWLPDVEVYVTPVGESVVGVAVLGRAPLRLADAIARLPELAARLGSVPASTPRGAGPLRQRTSARHRGRAVLVGDAAGYVDALTGEGLRIGFAEAEAAVLAIRDGDLDRYEAEWKAITRSYRWLTGTLVRATGQPVLRRAVVPAARALPPVFRAIVDRLAY